MRPSAASVVAVVAQPGAEIEHDRVVSFGRDFDARGVAPVPVELVAVARSRSAYPPEVHVRHRGHALQVTCCDPLHLGTRDRETGWSRAICDLHHTTRSGSRDGSTASVDSSPAVGGRSSDDPGMQDLRHGLGAVDETRARAGRSGCRRRPPTPRRRREAGRRRRAARRSPSACVEVVAARRDQHHVGGVPTRTASHVIRRESPPGHREHRGATTRRHEVGDPVPGAERRVGPLEHEDGSRRRRRRATVRARRGARATSRRPARARALASSASPTSRTERHDIVERLRIEGQHPRGAPEVRERVVDPIQIDGAHRAEVLREHDVGVELGQRAFVEAVQVLARGDTRADDGVDLRRRQALGQRRRRHDPPAPRLGRVVALERHADEIVSPIQARTRSRSPTGAGRRSARQLEDAALEPGDPQPREQRGEPDERAVHRPQAHVRRRRERGPEALAHVDERVGEHEDLQPADRLERRPRVVDAAEERERDHDDAEQQRHRARIEPGAEREPERAAHVAGERREREQHPPVDVEAHRRRRHDGRDREHEQRGEQPARARPRSPSGSRPATPASARARGLRSRACSRTPAPSAARPTGCPASGSRCRRRRRRAAWRTRAPPRCRRRPGRSSGTRR